MVIIHACLKACPSALCLSIESWICVIVTCVYFTCPCWISWYAVMNGLNLTCHSSAMLFPPCWLLLNCLCHPKLNEASMIQLSLFRAVFCFFFSLSLNSLTFLHFYINITAWIEMKQCPFFSLWAWPEPDFWTVNKCNWNGICSFAYTNSHFSWLKLGYLIFCFFSACLL